MPIAKGKFKVEMKPLTHNVAISGITLDRTSLAKTFEGDLVAKGTGEMLMAITATTGSAGYVAIERVDGMLNGRSGSFVLQHNGLMNKGVQNLSIAVVPDSGTGDLVGLSGKLAIHLDGPQHLYEFEYKLQGG